MNEPGALEFAIWKAINEGASRDLDRQKAAAAELLTLVTDRLSAAEAAKEAAQRERDEANKVCALSDEIVEKANEAVRVALVDLAALRERVGALRSAAERVEVAAIDTVDGRCSVPRAAVEALRHALASSPSDSAPADGKE